MLQASIDYNLCNGSVFCCIFDELLTLFEAFVKIVLLIIIFFEKKTGKGKDCIGNTVQVIALLSCVHGLNNS